MIILMNKKDLIITKYHKVFKYETGMDVLRFYIPEEYEGISLKDLNCVVEVERPYVETDTTQNPNTYTKDDGTVYERIYKYFPYDNPVEPYKEGRLSVTVPITTALTMKEGTITVWLTFLKPNEDTTKYALNVLETHPTSFPIIPNDSLSTSSKDNFDEVWEHTNIDALNNKVNNMITYEHDEDEDGDIDFIVDDDENEDVTDGGSTGGDTTQEPEPGTDGADASEGGTE